MTRNRGPDPITIEQLTESYRFDEELARLLTAFQYHNDITLTAAAERPLPTSAYTAPTPALEAVFAADASPVFVCYDARTHRLVNAIERTLTQAITDAVTTAPTPRSDGGAAAPLADGRPDSADHDPQRKATHSRDGHTCARSVGVVTPHNAQRGALEVDLPDVITANTVEKYQGGERDIITVSATVSDPEFARREGRFILNPRRVLVAISRSKLLTVVVCSTTLFEVAPEDGARLAGRSGHGCSHRRSVAAPTQRGQGPSASSSVMTRTNTPQCRWECIQAPSIQLWVINDGTVRGRRWPTGCRRRRLE